MAIAEIARSIQEIRQEPPKKVMSLSFVPEPRNRITSSDLVSVASHELNHALIAWACRVAIDSISVIPSGNILGRTTLAGSVSMETLKLIAAGGGVHTHDGAAEGFGSDQFKVEWMHHYHGGHSWESAKSRAEAIVSGFSKDVRRKASEIIAYLGEVSGSMMGDIMARAQMEVNEEKSESQPIIQFEMPKIESENRTIIEDLPNNIQRIIYVVVGKKDEEKYLCGLCQGINGHLEECPNAKIKDNSKENPFSLPKLFPRQGTIFTNV